MAARAKRASAAAAGIANAALGRRIDLSHGARPEPSGLNPTAGSHPSSSETTWRFNADGTASRLSVTRNFTAGLADAQTVDARWEPLVQTVRITYLPPSSGTFEFSYRVNGDTLYLASQPYARIAR